VKRYVQAFLLALALHAAGLWAWTHVRPAPTEAARPPELDASALTLSFAETPDEAARPAVAEPPAPAELPPPVPPAPSAALPPPVFTDPARPDESLPAAEIAVGEPRPAPDLVSTESAPLPAAEPVAARPAAVSRAPESAALDAPPRPAAAFRPTYPRSSRLKGEKGIVSLDVDVDAFGAAVRVDVVFSSGFPALDAAAVKAVRAARFTPANKDGRAVPGRLRIPFTFKLREAE